MHGAGRYSLDFSGGEDFSQMSRSDSYPTSTFELAIMSNNPTHLCIDAYLTHSVEQYLPSLARRSFQLTST